MFPQSVKGTWNIGPWNIRDFGVTELARQLLGKTASAEQTTRFNNPAVIQATKGSTAPITTTATVKPTTGGTTTTTNNNQNGQNTQTTDNNNNNNNGNQGIDDAARAQEEAARAAAEAKRQAAQRSYGAKVEEAGIAKGQAKGQYDWIIGALGSNKTDLLNQVTQNETTGIQNYEEQQKKTSEKYTTAKQDILSTYRDLQSEQERIMRGSGQGQSSRSQEATLRLNNLLGKDLSNITTNEADSLALIGNALTSFKTSILNTKNSIERETTQKTDKATLDYNQQIQTIDSNLNLSANEREDAYAAAETQLASDVANIKTWTAQQKMEYDKTVSNTKGVLDNFITSMTDSNGLLNSNLESKKAAANKTLKDAGLTTMDTETDITTPTAGVYQSSAKTYGSKEELDSALAAGQVTPLEYSQKLAQLQGSQATPSAIASTASTTSAGGQTLPTGVSNDPLLRALFA